MNSNVAFFNKHKNDKEIVFEHEDLILKEEYVEFAQDRFSKFLNSHYQIKGYTRRTVAKITENGNIKIEMYDKPYVYENLSDAYEENPNDQRGVDLTKLDKSKVAKIVSVSVKEQLKSFSKKNNNQR